MDTNSVTDSQSRVSTENSPWQVSQLSKSLKDWIDKLGRVWVEGELQAYSEKPAGVFASIRDLDVEMSVEIHAFANSGAEIAPGLALVYPVLHAIQPVFTPLALPVAE